MKTRESITKELERTLQLARAAERKRESHPFLPVVIESLESMIRRISESREERVKIAGALGRIVTDDSAFAESRLGRRILSVTDDFAEMS